MINRVKEILEHKPKCKNCESIKIAGKYIPNDKYQFIYYDYCLICESVIYEK